jgi:hypothetical protein
MADVDGIVNHGSLNRVTDAFDKFFTSTDEYALGEGYALVTLYEIPGEPIRAVNVYFGYAGTESSPEEYEYTAQATLNLPIECSSVAASYDFFVNALNGQTNPGIAQEQFRVNDAIIGAGLTGVITATDPWRGYLGPLDIPADPTRSNFYDHAEGDIRAFFGDPEDELVGANAFRIETERDTELGANKVGHSLAAVSFAADPVVVCLKPGDVCDDAVTASACVGAGGQILCAFDECKSDCNTNGIPDACDIAMDPQLDCDGVRHN